MPYIKQEHRENSYPQSAGELNFFISRLINNYLLNNSVVSYAHLNEVIGVLECAKLEVYRRIVAEYEDKKLEENGDVFSIRHWERKMNAK